MEKAENKNIQKVQNVKQGEASPNTKRRLKLHLKGPKLHINIPFFKNGHGHNDSSPEVFREISTSLPIESHMPSNMQDPTLYQDCECEPENGAEDSGSIGETVLLQNCNEDEPESGKHQSDLEENEKDSSSDTEVEKQVKFLMDESQQTTVSASDDDEVGDTPEEKGSVTAPMSIASKGKGCCRLKSCLKDSCEGRPRASTYPGPVNCLEARFERHVTFSPDTLEPRTRNCKYREWLEMKCPHTKVPSINIKHEKRKCQLQQMRKVNISDYMSRNYGGSFFSPMGSFGGDLMM